jgi:hypothetical protein
MPRSALAAGSSQISGEVAARRRDQHRAERLRLAGAGDEDEQLARGQQRAESHGQRVGRDVLEPAELRCRVCSRLRVQGDEARAVLQARARLVERDVAVVAEAEHREIDRRLVEEALVARALRLRIGRRAVEAVERAEVDPAELPSQVGAEAALVIQGEAAVLVELEDGCLTAPQRGVGAQGGVDAERGPPGREQHAQPRARTQPVGDQLGDGLRDPVRIGEDEGGEGQPRPQPRMPAMSSVDSTPTGRSVRGSTTTAWLVC